MASFSVVYSANSNELKPIHTIFINEAKDILLQKLKAETELYIKSNYDGQVTITVFRGPARSYFSREMSMMRKGENLIIEKLNLTALSILIP